MQSQAVFQPLQVIRVLVVRLQQQALSWISGNASHGTGESLTPHYEVASLARSTVAHALLVLPSSRTQVFLTRHLSCFTQ